MRTLRFLFGRRLERAGFTLALGLTWPSAQVALHYQIDFGPPHSHLFEVTLTVEKLRGAFVDFALPAWRPGRYVIQNFAANVLHFSAFDETSSPLPVEKIDKQTWRVTRNKAKTLRVQYQYYANVLDAGSSFLSEEEAFFNGSNLLVYVVGRRTEPVTLRIQYPEGWRVATGLARTADPRLFTAPDYDVLVDCPTMVSPTLTTFSFTYRNVPYFVHIQGEGQYHRDRLVADIEKIVRYEVDLMGGTPFRDYHFLFHFVPHPFSHGVEHLNSCSIMRGPADKFDEDEFYRSFLSVVAHEFFHAWNVKTIRPAAFLPYDYRHEVYTRLLWVSEGLSTYYGALAMKRTGFTDRRRFFDWISGMIDGLQMNPGRKVTSLEMASWDAWLTGYGSGPPNATVSFYSKGALVGLLLDLEIRQRTGNDRSLDDVMRSLYTEYGLKRKGLTAVEFQRAVERIVGRSFEEFFRNYVRGTEDLDYDAHLLHAGLRLRREVDDNKPAAFLGIGYSGNEQETTITNVLTDSPAYRAGLDKGDILLAIDRERAHQGNILELLKKKSPGDTVVVTVFRRNQLRDFQVVLGSGGNLKYAIKQIDQPTPLQKKIFESWTGDSWEGTSKKEQTAGDEK